MFRPVLFRAWTVARLLLLTTSDKLLQTFSENPTNQPVRDSIFDPVLYSADPSVSTSIIAGRATTS